VFELIIVTRIAPGEVAPHPVRIPGAHHKQSQLPGTVRLIAEPNFAQLDDRRDPPSVRAPKKPKDDNVPAPCSLRIQRTGQGHPRRHRSARPVECGNSVTGQHPL
jgi:hypothetical protein